DRELYGACVSVRDGCKGQRGVFDIPAGRFKADSSRASRVPACWAGSPAGCASASEFPSTVARMAPAERMKRAPADGSEWSTIVLLMLGAFFVGIGWV